ncbi:MAG: hypothetical protein NMNS01_22980 [Nitrosomonas sp.]|nr:MAG: hypothetical protein NMNS01_22980 [Nitrosomonas sp.]
MHESILPSVAPTVKTSKHPDVYADLTDLVRIQYKARGYTFLPRQPVHSVLAGRHASRLRGRGLNFEEIRRYLPGDDIRNMDWHVTARTCKPHVRVYTEERDHPVLLLIDQRQNMFFGSRRAMKSVVAAEAAALAAWRVFFQGDRVGAIVFNDHDIIEIKPHRSRNQVVRILETVTRLNHQLSAESLAAPNPAMYNEALHRAVRLASHDYLIMSISDGFGIDNNTFRLGTQVAAKNDVIVMFIYDVLEAALPNAGRLVFGQAGYQLEVDSSDATLRQKFNARFQDRFNSIESFCRQRSVPRIAINTEEDVAEQVRARLGYIPRRK